MDLDSHPDVLGLLAKESAYFVAIFMMLDATFRQNQPTRHLAYLAAMLAAPLSAAMAVKWWLYQAAGIHALAPVDNLKAFDRLCANQRHSVSAVRLRAHLDPISFGSLFF